MADNKQTSRPRKTDTRLKGIIWDLLRLQIKVTLTAGAALFLLILIIYSLNSPGGAEASGLFYHLARLGESPFALAGVTGVFMLVFLVSGWFYAYAYGLTLKKTVSHFIHQLKQFQRGSLSKKITVERNDELKKLADEVNELTDDLEQQIVSMRRLLNENAKLIEDAEKGASLEERRKLARDLHDAVSQELFAVSMSLGAVPKVLNKDPSKAEVLFKQIEQMVHHAQQELRALIMHLRPVTLEGKSLKQALSTLLEELCKKHPAMSFQGELSKIPVMEKGTEEQIFRVLQEGLSNVLRHAGASKVKLDAGVRGKRLLILLEDDGAGFDPDTVQKEKTGSYGLSSMKERMTELGGHLTIVSFLGKGTKLEFRVPVTQYETEEKEESR